MEIFGSIIGVAVFAAIIALIIYFLRKTGRPSHRATRRGNGIIRIGEPHSAEQAGEQGERTVRWYIGDTVEGRQYVLNDYIVAKGQFSSQIDHIVINPRGVFVIETKNYTGYVFGSDAQKQWTHVTNYGKEKVPFYSPVKQNETHVKKIRQIAGNVPVRSLVVFVQNNTENIRSSCVIPLYDLHNALNTGDDVLSADKMREIYDKLIRARSDLTDEEHTMRVLRNNESIRNGICPACGGRLVQRHGKYGDFYGCSNYPKCKFKRNIDNK